MKQRVEAFRGRRPHRSVLLLAVLALMGVVASPRIGNPDPATGSCPQFRCTATHKGVATSSVSSKNVTGLTPSWSFRTGDRVYGSPSLAAGLLYVPSEDAHVYAVDARTGVQRWAYRTGGAIWSTPAVAGGNVYFGSADGFLYAVNAATGQLRWRLKTDGDITGSPAVDKGVVYVGSNDRHVYAVDAAQGRVRWTFTAGDRVSSSPALADGLVYIGSNDGNLYALDAVTGAKRWSYKTDGWVWSGPTVSGGRVVFTSNGTGGEVAGEATPHGRLYALDSRTGKLLWSSTETINGFGSPVIAGNLVIASGYGGVSAHDVATGATKWTYAVTGYLLTSPSVVNDLVFAVDSGRVGDGALVALRLSDGTVLHQVQYPRLDFVYSSPVVSGKQLFFGTGDGALRSLSLPPVGGAVERQASPIQTPLLPYGHRDALGNMLDQTSVAELRLPGDGVSMVESSTDPRGLNDDFTNFHGLTDDGRKIMMDVKGAGVLTDLYMYYNVATTGTGALGPPLTQRDPAGAIAPKLAMYVDDRLVFDMNAAEFYAGGAGFPFVAPLTGEASAAQYSRVPVPFRKRLLVVAESAPTENSFWYVFYYTKFPDDRGVQSFDPERDRARYQALIDKWSAVDDPLPAIPIAGRLRGTAVIAPGKSIDLVNLKGAGQVQQIRLAYFNADPPVVTVPSSDRKNDSRAAEPLRATRITARWDGRPELGIDAPLGDFLGTGFGQVQDFDTIISGMHTGVNVIPQGWKQPMELSTLGKHAGISAYSRWTMPFAKSAVVSLANTLPAGGSNIEVAYEVEVVPAPVRLDDGGRLWRGEDEIGYFYAKEFNNYSRGTTSPHPDRINNDAFARLKGRGNYAGQVLNMRTHKFGDNAANLLYMEGDCMFWIDGTQDYTPNIVSTGHEECHDTGAYFQGDEANPSAGTTNRELAGDSVFVNTMDETSVFRWWVGDTIGFQERFEATVEHGTGNTYVQEEAAEQAGVAFYYLEGRPQKPKVLGKRTTRPAAPTGGSLPATGVPVEMLGLALLAGALLLRRVVRVL